ncbi:hypothetical protein QQS21_004495 [Conoideocrella luteorostrata]|uniref:Uncharacterized protein n=1 Tax=Conoideocrella luteorostrata TaxID=1105319 RepID=A0AAJ0FVD4_9HYPO|nr:hypothetical protein QQS21_004495 [Conoideocrella luteorostrata]
MESFRKGCWPVFVVRALLVLSSWMLLVPVSASPIDQARAPRDAQIITGHYGSPTTQARIVIHDAAGRPSWTWSVPEGKNISPELRRCLYDVCKGYGCAATENKWANNGDSVVAIHGFAAIVINHHPGRPTDKAITFGVCLDRDNMDNTHSVELLPDGKIAIATTSFDMTGNIKIFDLRAKSPFAPPIQQLDGIPAVHALVWDARASVLWAAGNDRSPLVQGSRSTLNAYRYRYRSFQPRPEIYVIAPATHLTVEWGRNTPWWDGGHAMTQIPNQRKLLITTDLDVHVFDINSRTFEHGESVQRKYLAGFTPVGMCQNLPRSDIKSVSYLPDGRTLYVQALWGETFSNYVVHLAGGRRIQNIWNQKLYRSRWFTRPLW